MNNRAEAAAYLVAGLLCCAALIWILQLWRADLDVPFYYAAESDLTFQCMLVKSIFENGWYVHNPRLGAPGVQNLLDFPMPDIWHFLSMKVIGWFARSWGAVVNIYFLAGFFAATWSMLGVLRYFKIARAPAIVVAVLFAFVPYHFYRNEDHLHFSAYYVISLAGIMLLWIMLDEPLFVPLRRSRFLVLPVPTRKGIAALVICGILGSSGAYTSFLTIQLLAVAGLYRLFEQRSFRRAVPAAILIAAIVATVTLNLLPNIVHILVDGKNPEVAVRSPLEAETYSLKLTQLVFPVTGHRIERWASVKAEYNGTKSRLPVSEGDGSALGVCFAAGFCFLLLTIVAGYPWPRHRELIRGVGRLNLGAFLLATMGGVGSILAWTISPQIRAYARFGIFIAFFSALALAAVLDEIAERWGRSGWRRWVFIATLAAILAGGLFDQTTSANVPPYDFAIQHYRIDAAFVAQAEHILPRGSMVLQLPYVPYPEYPPQVNMADYDLLRPYLQSTSLRWSYGALKGRYWDAWQRDLSTRPTGDVLDAAATAGFGAIYVDRNGYADRAAAIEAVFSGLGMSPIASRDGRFWLFNIAPYAQRLQSTLGPQEWSRARLANLNPPTLRWLPQCSVLEAYGEHTWRWCGGEARLMVENPGRARRIEIHGTLSEGASGPCAVVMSGPGLSETFSLSSNAPEPIRRTLMVPSGTSFFRLTSNCPRLHVGSDPRPLVFRVDDFQAVLADAAPPPGLVWGAGCDPVEQAGAKGWRQCSSSGELTIKNPGPAVDSSIQMILATVNGDTSPISITGPGFTESVMAGPTGVVFLKHFLVPAGNSAIRFSSQATPTISESGARKLVFRIENFRFGNAVLEPHVINVN